MRKIYIQKMKTNIDCIAMLQGKGYFSCKVCNNFGHEREFSAVEVLSLSYS